MTIITENTVAIPRNQRQPLLLRAIAWLFSVLFHPLFIPVIVFAYLAYIQPGYFLGISSGDKLKAMASVALNTIFFPVVTILLLKALGFIRSVFLNDRKERIIPYVAANIYYFWIFLVFKNQPDIPVIATAFMLAVFLSSSLGLVLNAFYKISMHALGMGSFLGFLLSLILTGSPYVIFLPFMMVVLITGLVCTSRLILSNHTPFDIYSGLFAGMICAMVSWLIFM